MAPPRKHDGTTRVQLQMRDRDYERLVSLKRNLECSTFAEVVRRSLKLMEAVSEAENIIVDGKEIMVV